MSVIRKAIPFSIAANIVIIVNSAVIVFHLLVLTSIIPFNVVWGGRLGSVTEMYVFESISMMVNLLLVLVVVTKVRMVSKNRSQAWLNVILWMYVILFSLNTFGNLASKTTIETYVATPLTLVLALLCYRLAIERNTGCARRSL